MSSYASRYANTYAFDMFPLTPDERFDYTLGQVVRDGVPAPGAGNLEHAATKDIYSFDPPGGILFI